MVKMDITNITYDSDSFDIVYCSHVLEHVTNERTALSEIHRVLKSTGWSIILVPITCEETFENQNITDPAFRKEFFGQEDHVRKYGRDFSKRLENAHFYVEQVKASDFLNAQEILRMGITEAAGEIYYCKKNNIRLTAK
jgi:ubiquinone/menaquinone biosynthesis C-methylase UbiE